MAVDVQSHEAEPPSVTATPGRERAVACAVIGLPLAALLAAPVWALTLGISVADVASLAGWYLVAAFGVTLGYHRLLTHQSFAVGPVMRALLVGAGSLALQGPAIRWVAEHRRHHAFSDRAGDPHSPHEQGGLAGLFHAHVGWMFGGMRSSVRRYAPDLLRDPVVRAIDRHYGLMALASLLLPALVGGLVGGTFAAALRAMFWGGLVRTALLHQTTWAVNSIAHRFGARPWNTRDRSTNNALVAWVTLGEGWHNNHHAFPTSARHGLGRWQFDPSWWLIALFAKLRLARDVRVPSEEQVRRRVA